MNLEKAYFEIIVDGAMEIHAVSGKFDALTSDVIVCPVFEDYEPTVTKELLDMQSLRSKLENFSFKGKFKDFAILPVEGKIKTAIFVGLGKKSEYDMEKLRVVSSKAIASSKKMNPATVALLSTGVADAKKETYELSYTARITD